MSKCPFSKVPGKGAHPIFGDTLNFIFKHPDRIIDEKRAKYGNVFKSIVFNKENIVAIDEKFTRWALIENSKNLDSKEAWEVVLKELFPNGLMLIDGEKHKSHRSIIAHVFKKKALEGYLKIMAPIVDDIIQDIGDEPLNMFPFFKELTLKVALDVFFGLSPKDELDSINEAITNIVKAAATIQINLPFTTYGKGIKARKYLVRYFKNLIQAKREHPSNDLFSLLCQAESDEGLKFTDQEVIDHLIFILMAAHDTTASTLTSLSYFLAKNPDWQDRIRDETDIVNKEDLTLKEIRNLEGANLAMKETLRIYPPLTSISRVSNKDLEFNEWRFPKGVQFSISVSYFHKLKNVWSKPNQWDPERFNSERQEDKKCPYAYSPFGAGLHHCIGYQFAEMQINLVIGKLLQKYRLVLPEDYTMPMKAVPLQEPRDGLPMTLVKL